MGAGCGQQHAAFAGQRDHLPPQIENVFAGFLNIAADLGADFDHRLVQFRLGAIHGGELGLGKNFGLDVGTKIARFRIDRLILLFDANAETGTVHPCTSWLDLPGCLTVLSRPVEGAAEKGTPAIFSNHSCMFPGLLHGEFGYLVHDPVEVCLADGVYIRIGRWIHEVDGVRNTVFAGEFHGVQVVAQGAAQREAVALDPLQQFGVNRRWILHIALVKRQRRIVLHDVNLLLADTVAAKIFFEVDRRLQSHAEIARLIVGVEELSGRS